MLKKITLIYLRGFVYEISIIRADPAESKELTKGLTMMSNGGSYACLFPCSAPMSRDHDLSPMYVACHR